MKRKYKILLLVFIILICIYLVFVFCLKTDSKDLYSTSIPTDIELSDDEEKVDAYLSKIKFDADKLYASTKPYGIIDWGDTSYSQELWEFSRLVPKGGDLHIHSEKVIPVSNLLDLCLQNDDVSIVLEDGPQYGYLFTGDAPKNSIPLKKAIKDKKITLEDIKKLIVSQDDVVLNGYLKSFNNALHVVSYLHNNVEMSRLIYEEGFRNSCRNNACFLEIRLPFTVDDKINSVRVSLVREAYYNVKEEYPELLVRIIASTGKGYKSIEDDYVEGVILSAIRLSKSMKDEYNPEDIKDFIIGFDLVGSEDLRKPLEEYSELLSSKKFQESGLKLFLHAGESLRIDNDSVIDAYLLNATRVGHGFNLYRFPSLMKKYADKNIALEISPLSNYRLGLIHDLRLHPALIYLQNGIPIVISSDDGLFFTEEPLVNDYYAAILSWDLDLAVIKQISLNNIIYSGLSNEEIKTLKSNWEKDWDIFISDMLLKIE